MEGEIDHGDSLGNRGVIKDGDCQWMTADGLLMLRFSGKPLHEPIAWGGPIVMNTREKLALAFNEIDAGTFIKEHSDDGTITGNGVNQGYYQ